MVENGQNPKVAEQVGASGGFNLPDTKPSARGSEQPKGPSHILNVAFTRLAKAQAERVAPEHLKHSSTDDPYFLRIKTEKNRIDPLFDQFPIVYTKPDRFLGLSGSGIVIPVGAYGEEWAERIVTNAHRMREETQSPNSTANILDIISEVTTEYSDTLRRHTYYGAQNWNAPEEGTRMTFHDTSESEAHTAAFLTQHRVEGFDDPLELYQSLIRDGVISKYSLVVPPTVTARMTISGFIFTDPIVFKNKKGKLQLDPEKVAHWYSEREKYPRDTGADTLDHRGCPGGRHLPGEQFTAVDMVAIRLAEYMQGETMDMQVQSQKTVANTVYDTEVVFEEPNVGGSTTKSIGEQEREARGEGYETVHKHSKSK